MNENQISWPRKVLAGLSHYTPAPHRLVFSGAFVWHTLAARFFIGSPFQMLRQLTVARPISFVAAEVLQYLGGLNIGYAILALQGLLVSGRESASRRRTALVLAIV